MSRYVIYTQNFACNTDKKFTQLYPDMALYRKYRREAGFKDEYGKDAYVNPGLPGYVGFKNKKTGKIDFFDPMWAKKLDPMDDPYSIDNIIESGWDTYGGWRENDVFKKRGISLDKTVKVTDQNKKKLVPKDLSSVPDLSYYSPDNWIYTHPEFLYNPYDNTTIAERIISPKEFQDVKNLKIQAAKNAEKLGLYSQTDIDKIKTKQKAIQDRVYGFLDMMRSYKTPFSAELNRTVDKLKDSEVGAYSEFMPFTLADDPSYGDPFWQSGYVKKITTDPKEAANFYYDTLIPFKERENLLAEREKLEHEVEKELGLKNPRKYPFKDRNLILDENCLKFYKKNPDPNKYSALKNLWNWDNQNLLKLGHLAENSLYKDNKKPEYFKSSEFRYFGNPDWYLEHGYSTPGDIPKITAAIRYWLPNKGKKGNYYE